MPNKEIKKEGAFVREESGFRNWITKDGSPGPTGQGGFPAEKGRYHLYVSYACPWANRTLITRNLKGLQDYISVSVVHPHMDEKGWNFKEYPGSTEDPVYHAEYLREIYQAVDPDFQGSATVPILFDLKEKNIVNNESSEIIQMLNQAFDDIGAKPINLRPEKYLEEIEEWNDRIYDHVNNGVYKAGFATKQEVYEDEVSQLFQTLDQIEEHLEGKKFMVGDQLTETDVRLFVTLIRFDAVYFGHFKCNFQQIRDYENLARYTRELYQMEEFKETIHMDHIKYHYYTSHPSINPNRIVPKGPVLDYLE